MQEECYTSTVVTRSAGKEWLARGIKEPPSGHRAGGVGGVVDGCCEWCSFQSGFEQGESER